MTRSTRRATYQDVLDAPAHHVAEIVDGTLHLSPRPAPLQALTSGTLHRTLAAPFGRARGGPDASRPRDPSPESDWWIIREPELHLGEDIVVPDWVGWRRERMPNLPETAYVTRPPDWVCEIVSDSARGFDLHAKRPVYAREGVRHLWLVESDHPYSGSITRELAARPRDDAAPSRVRTAGPHASRPNSPVAT